MRTKDYIFIDGKKTRKACDYQAGEPHGITKLCQEKGLSPVTLHEICRNGYGTFKTVKIFMDAGIPIVKSPLPVPSRLVREHSRVYRKGETPKVTEEKQENLFKLGDELIEMPGNSIKLPNEPPKHYEVNNISLEDFIGKTSEETAKVKQMRDVIIKGLTEIITELYKI